MTVLDFPSNPTIGQVFDQWKWDGTTWTGLGLDTQVSDLIEDDDSATQAALNGRYLTLSGTNQTLAKKLTVAYDNPRIVLTDATGAPVNAKSADFSLVNGALYLRGRNDADAITFTPVIFDLTTGTIAMTGAAAVTVPDAFGATHALNRQTGDARYAQVTQAGKGLELAYNNPRLTLTDTAGAPVNAGSFDFSLVNGVLYLRGRSDTDAVTFSPMLIDLVNQTIAMTGAAAVTVPDAFGATHALNRQTGDARYALAGSGLLAYRVYGPGTLVTYSTPSTTTPIADVDPANLTVSFEVPASGVVEVELSGNALAAGTSLSWGLKDGAADVAGSGMLINSTIAGRVGVTRSCIISGLTPGAIKSWKWGYLKSGAGAPNMTADNALTGPMVMKVRAVPASVSVTGGALRVRGNTGGDQDYSLTFPITHTGATSIPLAVYFHGQGGDVNQRIDDPTLNALRTAGFAVVTADFHGSSWGNQASLTDLQNVINAIVAKGFTINRTLLFAGSMGGLTSLNSIVTGMWASYNLRGWYGTMPVCSLRNAYDHVGDSFTPQIEIAYGFTGAANFETATNGFDPVGDRVAANYPNIRYRFLASPSDVTVPQTLHTDLLRTMLGGTTTVENTLLATTGVHGDVSHFNASDITAFATRVLGD